MQRPIRNWRKLISLAQCFLLAFIYWFMQIASCWCFQCLMFLLLSVDNCSLCNNWCCCWCRRWMLQQLANSYGRWPAALVLCYGFLWGTSGRSLARAPFVSAWDVLAPNTSEQLIGWKLWLHYVVDWAGRLGGQIVDSMLVKSCNFRAIAMAQSWRTCCLFCCGNGNLPLTINGPAGSRNASHKFVCNVNNNKLTLANNYRQQTAKNDVERTCLRKQNKLEWQDYQPAGHVAMTTIIAIYPILIIINMMMSQIQLIIFMNSR